MSEVALKVSEERRDHLAHILVLTAFHTGENRIRSLQQALSKPLLNELNS